MKEQAAGKMLYRGAFSVGNPSGGKFFNPFNFAVKGIANTGVLNWGGKLLALYEVKMLLSHCYFLQVGMPLQLYTQVA